MEFALVAPLVALCLLALIATAVTCMKVLSLHDLARTAARHGAVAPEPCATAAEVVQRSLPTARTICAVDPAWGTITVEIRQRLTVPLFDVAPEWTSQVLPRATASFVVEPPPIIG